MNEWLNGLDGSVLRPSSFKGPFTLSLNFPLVHSFLIHSFLPPARTVPIHSCALPFTLTWFIHSLPCRHSLQAPAPTWHPRARLWPRAPRVRPGWALRGEPLNQPRLRGAGAGGKPGWGRGAGAPCGKPGGVGEPRPRRLQARSASVGRAWARGGGGGGGSGFPGPCGPAAGGPAGSAGR